MHLYVMYPDDTVGLRADTPRTVLHLRAATTTPFWLDEVGISFSGWESKHGPVLVELVRQANDGSWTDTFISNRNPHSEKSSAGAALGRGAAWEGGEPTDQGVLRTWEIRSDGGVLAHIFDEDEMPMIPADNAVGVRCTAGAVVNLMPYMVYGEL